MERRLLQRPFSQGERRNGYRRMQKSIIGRNVRVGEVAKDVTLPDTCKKFRASQEEIQSTGKSPVWQSLFSPAGELTGIIDLPDQERRFLGSNVNLSNVPS